MPSSSGSRWPASAQASRATTPPTGCGGGSPRGSAASCLFGWNVRDVEQVAALTAALRAENPARARVAIDEEGGDVTRLEVATGSSFPGNLALGLVDDVG